MDKIENINIPTVYDRPVFARILTAIQNSLNGASDGYLFPIRKITASDSMNLHDSVIIADATSGNIVFTLKPALEWEGKRISVKKIDATANTVTIDGNASETIDGAATKVISAQYVSHELASQGGAVYIL